MIIGSADVIHKLTELVNWFTEQYDFQIKGLDFHPRTIASQKEIYPFAYAAWCFLSTIKLFKPTSFYSPRFAPSEEVPRFMEHLYRREFFNEKRSAETTHFTDLVFQYDRTRTTNTPKYFSTPTLLDELLPVVTAEIGTTSYSFWFKQQLLRENNYMDPNQKSAFPEIQIRPNTASAWCKVLPGEWDEAEILIGDEKVTANGRGNLFPSSDMLYGGHLGRKPLVIACKTKVDKIKLDARDELREIIRLIGTDRLLLIAEHEIWSKFATLNLNIPLENISINNRWDSLVLEEFLESHRQKFDRY